AAVWVARSGALPRAAARWPACFDAEAQQMTAVHSPPVSGLGFARTEPQVVSASAASALDRWRTALRALPPWRLRVPPLRRPAIRPAPHRDRQALFRFRALVPAALRQGSTRPE